MQFGPSEDFDRYPRTLASDLAIAKNEGVDLVFNPSRDELYPNEPSITVHPGPLADELEGVFRPGHFSGVLTVVSKLLHLTAPDLALFGEKDYQQLTLIREMVCDLDMDVDIVPVPTVREPDGLAMSSRNRYLSPDERRAAAVLSQALRAAQHRAAYGVPPARWAAMSVLQDEPLLELDYLALRDSELGELEDYPQEPVDGRILVAGRVGSTRLIDNMPLLLGPESAADAKGDS